MSSLVFGLEAASTASTALAAAAWCVRKGEGERGGNGGREEEEAKVEREQEGEK